ncbi:gametocyte-specific factor 1 homolog [Culicoides brevitarsis]|uniref:gametocyte-specific factor 1 homolog n=1 Tax=Culicoides brevitarsis TaxID=469753 RepID=UPI00307BCECB
MELPPGFEKVIPCPYNPSHMILPHRMQTHLTKCAKQHPHMKLEICPFNVTHRMRYAAMKEHKLRCPDRVNFEQYLIDVGTSKKEETQDSLLMRQQIQFNPFMTPEESWDDLNVPTYDFKKAAESKNVLRSNNGMTKYERQVFREKERIRLNEIQEKEFR